MISTYFPTLSDWWWRAGKVKVKHVSHKLSLYDYPGDFEQQRINHGKIFCLVYFSVCTDLKFRHHKHNI